MEINYTAADKEIYDDTISRGISLRVSGEILINLPECFLQDSEGTYIHWASIIEACRRSGSITPLGVVIDRSEWDNYSLGEDISPAEKVLVVVDHHSRNFIGIILRDGEGAELVDEDAEVISDVEANEYLAHWSCNRFDAMPGAGQDALPLPPEPQKPQGRRLRLF